VFVDSSNGCCLLMSESLFNKEGLFGEINCPQLAADVELQLSAKARGPLTECFVGDSFSQLDSTNYYSNFRPRDLFRF